MTHADIITAKGATEIAARIGVPPINVRMWKSRNTIPRSAWAELIDAYPDVTLDALKAGERHRAAANDAAPANERGIDLTADELVDIQPDAANDPTPHSEAA